MKRQVADRIFLCLLVLLDLSVGLWDAGTLRHAVFETSGTPARIVAFALLAACLVTLADTVINDVLPARYSLRCAWRWRQRLLLLLAVLLTMQGFVFIKLGLGLLIAVTYLVMAARAASIAFLDLHYEHQSTRRDRRTTDLGDIHA